MWAVYTIVAGLLGGTIGIAALCGISNARHTNQQAARYGAAQDFLAEHGIVASADTFPDSTDLEWAHALLDATADGNDPENLIASISAATHRGYSEYAEMRAAHGADELGVITFCGAQLVPGLGRGTEHHTFVDAASGATDPIWAEYTRFCDRLDQMNAYAAAMLDVEARQVAAGQFPSDAILTAAVFHPAGGNITVNTGPAWHPHA